MPKPGAFRLLLLSNTQWIKTLNLDYLIAFPFSFSLGGYERSYLLGLKKWSNSPKLKNQRFRRLIEKGAYFCSKKLHYAQILVYLHTQSLKHSEGKPSISWCYFKSRRIWSSDLYWSLYPECDFYSSWAKMHFSKLISYHLQHPFY